MACECGNDKIVARGMCSACYHRYYRQNNPQYKNAPGRRQSKRSALREHFLGLQEGKCAICGSTGPKWHLDHDHTSGNIRGVLCAKCNLGLGQFNDDPQLLKAAIDHVNRVQSSMKYPV